MCLTCGCGSGETHIEGEAGAAAQMHTHADGSTHSHSPLEAGGSGHDHAHSQAHGHSHEHAHEHPHADGSAHTHAHTHVHAHAPEHRHDLADDGLHGHDQGHDHVHTHGHAQAREDLHYGLGEAGNAAPGMTQRRMVQIERDILAKNDGHAQRNRQWLAERGVLALNLVSSPGSGKTSLLVRTIQMLQGRLPVAVVEGDQQTSFDADRIRATGAPALQINTGKGCHLDAAMIETALARLAPTSDSVLMIENVGNLVCPAGFDLGEAHKVVVLSVTEGEDKPLKYPDMFAAASLMLLNKVDLLPHLHFDVAACLANARRVNPDIQILQVSATTGEGMEVWLEWIAQHAALAQERRRDELAALQRHIVELQARVAELQGPTAA